MSDSPSIERFGSGSVGGKGRALGYLSKLVQEPAMRRSDRAVVRVPPAVIITTEEFQDFVDENDLSHCITSHDDAVIVDAFLRGRLSHTLANFLMRYVEEHDYPIAVRSSSLNEDAYDHPFAGLYSTVLLPNNAQEAQSRFAQLAQAIKLVFASTYLEAPKSYMRSYDLPIEEEAMAVIIQAVAGRAHVSRFYPRLAGVARSLNYFPVGGLSNNDGICRLVVGLGFRALEGGEAMSFSPRRPMVRPSQWSPREIAKSAQKSIDVLDLTRSEIDVSNERATIKTVPIGHVRKDGVLDDLQSWWNRDDDTVYEGGLKKGDPLLTFGRLLRGELFPFADQISQVLDRAEAGFQGPVEIEFTADFERSGGVTRSELNLVQVRRIGQPRTGEAVELEDVPRHELVLASESALGNGVWSGIRHIVYVSPRPHSSDQFVAMASEIGELNHLLTMQKSRYLLIGPGRWGSKNRTLGVPVTYNQVAGAGGIVEVSSADFRVQPSQGTHFFHNITAGQVFYISLDLSQNDWLNIAWLEAQTDARGLVGAATKLIEVKRPLTLRVDGRTQRAQCDMKHDG